MALTSPSVPVGGLALAALLLLAGCTNIHNDQTRTKVEGTMAGAATGGVIGGVIAGVVSLGSPTSIAQGAAIGAQIGGGAGYAYAVSVANRKREYASREAWLEACIAEAQTTAQKSRDYSRAARQIIARQQREIAAVLEDGQVRPEDKARADALRTSLDTSMTNLHAAMVTWDAVLDAHRRVVQRYHSEAGMLSQQVDDLSQHQADLHEDYDSFTALRAKLGP